MKTFVTDDYQVTLMDNGGVDIIRLGSYIIRITYDPDNKKLPWVIAEGSSNKPRITVSKSISGLGLTKPGLEKLHEALELVGKQDIMDNEIVFVNKKGK